MTRLLLAALSMMAISQVASAALAPNYQRAKEMTAIIEAVAAQLPQHPITKVIYQKTDEYRIIAGPCSIRASIVSKPSAGGLAGPRQFEVKLGRARCR
ncbi:MAG: hypothetical protein AB7E81_01400 [Hyphomicrobiaceae bacterium]